MGVDEAARELAHKTFPATTQGHRAAVMWARATFGRDLRWAVEDCRHLSARLELGPDGEGAGGDVDQDPAGVDAGGV